MEDVEFSSARAIAAAIASRQISSREVLDHLLDRIAKLDGAINAVVTIDGERARAEATAADDMVARGDELGPLHGVPMTVKDSWETAGMRTTSGAPELREHVPESDAWPVAALRAAGAVVFGKTNLPYYAGDCQTYNDVFGTTNNPVRPGAHVQRFVGRVGRGAGVRVHAARAGLRHRRLDPQPRACQRCGRSQAVVRDRAQPRAHPWASGEPERRRHRRRRSDGAHGGGLRARSRRARRSGPVEHAGVAAGTAAATQQRTGRIPRRGVGGRPGLPGRPRRGDCSSSGRRPTLPKPARPWTPPLARRSPSNRAAANFDGLLDAAFSGGYPKDSFDRMAAARATTRSAGSSG